MDVPVIMLEFQQSKSYEKLEWPQSQLIVGVQDIPVVSQRQVPTVLQVQFLEVVDMPVVVQRQVCSCSESTRLSTSLSWRRGRSSWLRLSRRP